MKIWPGLVVGVLWMVSARTVEAQLQPSPNNLYLIEHDGTPVYLDGSAGWTLFVNPTYPDARRYLDSCNTHGINFLEVMIVAKFGGPGNVYGVQPWVGTQTFSSTPNTPYFAHCDSIIGYARSKGIYLHVYPDYLGYDPSQGFSGETGNSTAAQMKAWGQYLGNRWKDSTNIVWAIGGDTDPTPWQAKLDSLVAGIQLSGDAHLISTRDEVETTGDTHWRGHPWMTLNNYYSYYNTSQFTYARSCRGRRPAKPFFLSETYYENESPLGHVTTQVELRTAMYWSTLWGAAGQVFGNCPVWGFDHAYPYSCSGHWYDNLNSQGHINARWIGKLIRNRTWYTFAPDTNNVVLTSGQGSSSDFAVAAYATDSTTIMVYMPSSRQVTVTSARLKGDSTHAWWFDPSSGATTDLGIQTRGSHTYTPPTGDWVLVLDAKSMGYPPPGVDLTSSPQAPVLATPSNGQTGLPTSPTLTWNASTGATTYHVQVGLDAGFGTVVADQNNVVGTSQVVSGLSGSTTYYWHVAARNSAGSSSYSAPWSFSTAAFPPQPVLVAPANSSTGQPTSLPLRWRTSAGATSYRVQLARDTAFAVIVVDDSTMTDSTRQIDGLANATTYFWRARGKNASGPGPWSGRWSFTTLVTGVGDRQVLPSSFRLRQNYPDPFNPATTIQYDLPYPALVTVEVFNVVGQKVRTLVSAAQPAGSYSVQWDGRDDRGRRVSSGIYIYRAYTNKDSETRKMLLLQ